MTPQRSGWAAAVAAAHAALLAALASATLPTAPAGGAQRPPLWVRLLSEAPAAPAAPVPAVTPPAPARPVAAAPPPVAPATAEASPAADTAPVAEPTLTAFANTAATAANVAPATPAAPAAAEPLRVALLPAAGAEPAPPAAPQRPAPRREPPGHAGCAQAPHPPLLRERGIEGRVQLRVHVGADGRALQVQLLQSSGWRLFDEAALAQARGCRFRPAREDETPVDGWVEFPVRFTLQG